jgi:hypothetical protein
MGSVVTVLSLDSALAVAPMAKSPAATLAAVMMYRVFVFM